MNGALTQLYQSYLPLLAQGGLNAEHLQSLVHMATENFNKLRDSLSVSGFAWPDLKQWGGMTHLARPWDLWTGALLAGEHGDANTLHPLRIGMERTFGALADAFGLDPMRKLDDAWREVLSAGLTKQRAQIEYLSVVGEAWAKGTQRLLHELNELGKRGESVDSLLSFIRLWAKTVDAAMHEALQSERGLAATAKLIRVVTSYREQLQRAVTLASEALQVPTRADLDEAYREIQELKREVGRLKKAMRPAAPAGKSPSVKETKV
jgi:Poly(R)-hydroxyalkanoic acid synthase subunit (PHA_synth_III_E)